MFKGISPLIAGVLLISFTLAISGVLFTWVSTSSQQKLKTAGECSFSIFISDPTYDSRTNMISFRLRNTGKSDLEGLTVSIIYSSENNLERINLHALNGDGQMPISGTKLAIGVAKSVIINITAQGGPTAESPIKIEILSSTCPTNPTIALLGAGTVGGGTPTTAGSTTTSSTTSSTTTTTLVPVCGDGVCTGSETCSPGPDACEADCGECLSLCGTLNTANKKYQLTQDVSSAGTCFTVDANNVSIDCNGYLINYSRSLVGYGVNISSSRENQTIKNCRIEQGGTSSSSYGIFLNKNASLNKISSNNILTTGSVSYGIFVWTDSDDNNITFNVMNSTDGPGIYSDGNRNFIDRNNITTYASGILSYGNGTTISNNNIVVYGNNYVGIYFNGASKETVFNNSVVSKASSSSFGVIYLDNSNQNLIYNNLFNASTVIVYISPAVSNNNWNTTLTPGTNIVGGANIGGNYYANSTGTGFSESTSTCADVLPGPRDYICDTTLTHATNNIDFLPLAKP